MREAENYWTSFCKALANCLYPGKCALCGLLSDDCPCPVCVSQMSKAAPDFLDEFGGALAFRACAFAYEGRARQAVTRLKYARSTGLAKYMSGVVANRLQEVGAVGDVIVPVPIHRSRRAWRGFNQAELLAAGGHGLTIRTDLLRRVRSTRPQAGLTLKERQENLRGAFKASPKVAGLAVLLVDDVVTSGHTARECARALRVAGATQVGIVAFAGNLE